MAETDEAVPMEDEGFVDDDFIEETAWEYVARHGNAAIPILRGFAEITERAGDVISAQTWCAIADAIERKGMSIGGRDGASG